MRWIWKAGGKSDWFLRERCLRWWIDTNDKSKFEDNKIQGEQSNILVLVPKKRSECQYKLIESLETA